MARHFENWLEAYEFYANDGFAPPQFNKWAGLSAIAGALERKVWLPWSDTYAYHPNIYVLLVSLPGAGKSISLGKAVSLLHEVNANGGRISMIPSQVTEAKFIEIMGEQTGFEVGTAIHQQSAGYYFASEASNSLKNVYGDFIGCLTDFYDCPEFWEKATKIDDRLTLRNVCMNVLAGSTFDYLSKPVTDDNIMGGFASRLLYVVHKEKLVRNQKFQLGGFTKDTARANYRRALIEDLVDINRMVGPFTGDSEFGGAWEKWWPAFEERRQSHPSEKMQSLLVRTNTNMLKVAMLHSAARNSSRKLTLADWEAARAAIEPMEAELPAIFRESKALDTTSQEGLNQAIFKFFDHRELWTTNELRAKLLFAGFQPMNINKTIDHMRQTNQFQVLRSSGEDMTVKLLANPNHNV